MQLCFGSPRLINAFPFEIYPFSSLSHQSGHVNMLSKAFLLCKTLVQARVLLEGNHSCISSTKEVGGKGLCYHGELCKLQWWFLKIVMHEIMDPYKIIDIFFIFVLRTANYWGKSSGRNFNSWRLYLVHIFFCWMFFFLIGIFLCWMLKVLL